MVRNIRPTVSVVYTKVLDFQEAIGSTAAVAQLLGQTIALWQEIDLARESVRIAPKVLADTTKELSKLRDTLDRIRQEPKLQSPAIEEQVDDIRIVTEELHHVLETMKIVLCKSALRQTLRALLRRSRDETKLNDVLRRLEGAKEELMLRIQVHQTEMMGEIKDGLNRFEQKTTEKRVEMLMKGNMVDSNSDQINGIAGADNARTSVTAKVLENKALRNSRQKNLVLGGTIPMEFHLSFK
ncbi:hypothetical protein F4810DRAFT_6396 [Camillea tinctor]|nr:hypothetical protein F4810DRAFT_6396 [Camillea tinctor]